MIIAMRIGGSRCKIPVVPAGTRVGAMANPDDTSDVTFETSRELVLTQARIASVFVRQPAGDRYADRTELAKAETWLAAYNAGSGRTWRIREVLDRHLAVAAGAVVASIVGGFALLRFAF